MSVLSHDFVQANLVPYLSVTSFNLLIRTSKDLKAMCEQVLQDGIMRIEGGRLGYLHLVDEFKLLGDAKCKIVENYLRQEIERETWSITFNVRHYWMDGGSTEKGERTVLVTWNYLDSCLEIAFADNVRFSECLSDVERDQYDEPDAPDDVEDEEYRNWNDIDNFVSWTVKSSETGFFLDDEEYDIATYQGWMFEEFGDLWGLIASGEIMTLPYDERKISWR